MQQLLAITTSVNKGNFALHRRYIAAWKYPYRNNDIINTPPDKGRGAIHSL